MKIDKMSLEVLQNFININKGLYIPQGNLITTIKDGNKLIAQYKSDMYIDKAISIFDATTLIKGINGILNYDSEKDTHKITLHDESMIVSTDIGAIEFQYQNPEFVINGNPVNKYSEVLTNDKQPELIASFVLTSDNIKRILTASSLTNSDKFRIDSKGIHIGGGKNSSAHTTLRVDFGDNVPDFSVEYLIDNFKLIGGDYNVEVRTGNNKVFSPLFMRHATLDLIYIIVNVNDIQGR